MIKLTKIAMLLAILCLSTLAGCAADVQQTENPQFSGFITEIHQGSITVRTHHYDDIAAVGPLFWVSVDPNSFVLDDFRVGDEVTIVYDGVLLHTHPVQVAVPLNILRNQPAPHRTHLIITYEPAPGETQHSVAIGDWGAFPDPFAAWYAPEVESISRTSEYPRFTVYRFVSGVFSGFVRIDHNNTMTDSTPSVRSLADYAMFERFQAIYDTAQHEAQIFVNDIAVAGAHFIATDGAAQPTHLPLAPIGRILGGEVLLDNGFGGIDITTPGGSQLTFFADSAGYNMRFTNPDGTRGSKALVHPYDIIAVDGIIYVSPEFFGRFFEAGYMYADGQVFVGDDLPTATIDAAPAVASMLFSRADHVMSRSPIREHLTDYTTRELTAEQFRAAFGDTDMLLNAFGTFCADDLLISITAHEFEWVEPFDEIERALASSILGEAGNPIRNTGLTIGMGERHHNTMFAHLDGDSYISIVHDVPVTALFVDTDNVNGYFLQAQFHLNNAPVHITLWHDDLPAGKAHLTGVVNALILNPPDMTAANQ